MWAHDCSKANKCSLLRIDINTREEKSSLSVILNLTNYIILALFGLRSLLTYKNILQKNKANGEYGRK